MLYTSDIQLTKKTLDVSPVNGKLEYDTISGHLYFVTGGTRFQIDQQTTTKSLGLPYSNSLGIFNSVSSV